MGFRFSKRLRVAPGIRLNLSKSGVSASLGTRGAWLTFGRRRARATLSLPGTGLSYSETLGGPPPRRTPATAPAPEPIAASEPVPRRRRYAWLWLVLVLLGIPLVWALLNV